MEGFSAVEALLVESKAIVLLLLLGIIVMLWKQLQAVTTQRDGYIEKFIDNAQANTKALMEFTGALEALTKEMERKH